MIIGKHITRKKELMSLKGKVKKIGIFHIWVLTIRVKKWKNKVILNQDHL